RNYRTAPTYCECSLVHWLPGNPRYMEMLGKPLQETRLSVFAPHQVWSLQGDSILCSVEYNEAPGAGDIYWSTGIDGGRAPITDYRKLDLVVPTSDEVSWTVDVPAGLEHAEFRSAVLAGSNGPVPGATGISSRVSIHCERQADSLVFSRALGT